MTEQEKRAERLMLWAELCHARDAKLKAIRMNRACDDDQLPEVKVFNTLYYRWGNLLTEHRLTWERFPNNNLSNNYRLSNGEEYFQDRPL